MVRSHATCPPTSTVLILSRLRHSRLGAPNSWTLTLRTSRVPARSLDLCHLSSSRWTVLILSRLRHSRSRKTSLYDSRCPNPRYGRSRDTRPLSDERLRSLSQISRFLMSSARTLVLRTPELPNVDIPIQPPSRDFRSAALRVRF
jgi:hypothetical protein